MEIPLTSAQIHIQLRRYIRAAWLPLTLIFLFVLQSHLFTILLDIAPTHYIIRRTITSFAFGILIFGPAILFKKPVGYLYLIITSFFTSFLFAMQYLYYTYTGGFLQASALLYAREGASTFGLVQTLLTYKLLFFALGLLCILLAFILEQKGSIQREYISRTEKIYASILIILFASFGYGYVFLRENMESGVTTSLYRHNKLHDVNAQVAKIGIINFSVANALSTAFFTDKVSAADLASAKTWLEAVPQPTVLGKTFGIASGRNLIFIQVESLENVVVGEKINEQEISPRLNQLAKEGVYFSNYHALIGPGTTADAEFSTLNSLYPLMDTVAFVQYAYNQYQALPGLLKNHGYSTYAFHGDVPSFWNRANIYPQLGYEKFFGQRDYNIPRKIGVYLLGDEDFFAQSILKLQHLPQPFMTTLITLSSHSPFVLPDDLQTLTISSTTTLNVLQQNYLQSVRYTDKAIGAFIDNLKTTGLYDNSLIVIFGDHGGFSNIGTALGLQKTIFPDWQNNNVPLIILAPSTTLPNTIITNPGSHLDLYPTITHLLGITPPSIILGQDMLTTNTPIVVRRNLVSGTINSFITNRFAFHASPDMAFDHGVCRELPGNTITSLDHCRPIYDKEAITIKTSDTFVRENMFKAVAK